LDVHRPTEILDKMIDLARWWETPDGQRYGENFIKSVSDKHPPFLYPDPSKFGLSRAFFLARSLPYFITDQMVDKIWQFSKGFDTWGFYPEDVPSDYGFMWLAKPVHILDGGGRIQCERAITWEKQEHGVAFCFYSDKHDTFDETNLALRATEKEGYSLLPELGLSHIQPIKWGDRTQWSIDAEGFAANNIGPLGEKYIAENVAVSAREQFNLCRFILATWEWMGEQLPYRAMPNRQGARRLGRSRLDARDVLVIDLQPRAKNPLGPATHQVVEWHYRWRVREHKRRWRDKKTGEYRTTTVHSYIKGPENAPMVERDILFNIRRGHAPV
jgi:hypothetical protein